MNTHIRILTVLLLLVAPISGVVAQGTTAPSADMRIDRAGYQYIEVTNPTSATYSLTIDYKMKFANGERRQQSVTWIIDPGKTQSAFKCSMRSPNEQISDVKVVNIRKM